VAVVKRGIVKENCREYGGKTLVKLIDEYNCELLAASNLRQVRQG